jgi:hypothetical protein
MPVPCFSWFPRYPARASGGLERAMRSSNTIGLSNSVCGVFIFKAPGSSPLRDQSACAKSHGSHVRLPQQQEEMETVSEALCIPRADVRASEAFGLARIEHDAKGDRDFQVGGESPSQCSLPPSLPPSPPSLPRSLAPSLPRSLAPSLPRSAPSLSRSLAPLLRSLSLSFPRSLAPLPLSLVPSLPRSAPSLSRSLAPSLPRSLPSLCTYRRRIQKPFSNRSSLFVFVRRS